MDYIPPINDNIIPVTSACIVAASNHYEVAPALLLSILKVEGGSVGKVSKNKNGTVDIGPMQINSVNLPELLKYNISMEDIKNNGCLNVHIGAYYIKKAETEKRRLSDKFTEAELWESIGNYHSKNRKHNLAYIEKVSNALSEIPQEWKNFDCEKYNACSMNIDNISASRTAKNGANTNSNIVNMPTGYNADVPAPSFRPIKPYK